ncbi:MAG: class I SAM-dependent methyltransferase [Candidatus Hydrogenedentota bacterium]
MSILDDSIQERITAFWSAVASGYEAYGGNVPVRDSDEHRAWIDAIRELLPAAPSDVLDIGTGTGFVAIIAAKLGHRVTGTDLSTVMLDEARAEAKRRGVAVAFTVEDAVAPQLPSASFDAVICRHLLWTLRQPELALTNWSKLLRPGGRVVAIDGLWSASGDEPDLFKQHYTKATRAALPVMGFSEVASVAEMFERAGFEQVKVRDLAPGHGVAEDTPGLSPWYVITALA